MARKQTVELTAFGWRRHITLVQVLAMEPVDVARMLDLCMLWDVEPVRDESGKDFDLYETVCALARHASDYHSAERSRRDDG